MSDDLVGSILDHNSLGQTFVNFCTADVLKRGSQCATVPSANFLSADSSPPRKFSPTVSTERVHIFVVVEVCEEVSKPPRRGEKTHCRRGIFS